MNAFILTFSHFSIRSGHCKQLASKWRKVAESLHGVIRVSAVNCDDEKALCQAQGIKGYPSIKAFKEGKLIEYHGDRSAASLRDWGLSLLPQNVQYVRKDADLQEFLKSTKSKARWGVGILLFSSKKETSALYKSLSLRYKNKIAFGEIKDSAKDLVAKFKVKSYPTLIAVCGGDERSLVPFDSEMKNSQLVRFLNSFYSGKKCAEAITLDSSTDFTKMKVSQLKQLLAAKGISCKDCFEKNDFIKRLKSAYNINEQ